MSTLPDQDQTSFLLYAGLCRSYYVQEDSFELLKVYGELLYRNVSLPLPGVVLDLYALFFNDVSVNRARMDLPGDLKYRDQFLFSLDHSLEMDRLREIASAYRGREFSVFFSRFLELFFTRLGYSDNLEFKQSYLKDSLSNVPERQELELVAAMLKEDEEWWVHLDLSSLGDLYQEKRPVLLEEDFWDLSMLKIIASDALRYALKSTLKLKSDLEKDSAFFWNKLKKEVVFRLSEKEKEIGQFPVGGLAEISTKGKLENLLRSELIYLDSGLDPYLFDVKYLEGELLYYQRDNNEEDMQEKVIRLRIHTRDEYPGLKELSIHPFSLFAMISLIIDRTQKFHRRYKFKYEVYWQVRSTREEEFFLVFQSLLQSSVALNRASLSLVTEEYEEIAKPDPFEFHLGGVGLSSNYLNWNKEGYTFVDYQGKSTRYEFSVGLLPLIREFILATTLL